MRIAGLTDSTSAIKLKKLCKLQLELFCNIKSRFSRNSKAANTLTLTSVGPNEMFWFAQNLK
jgi:hypothetical protein